MTYDLLDSYVEPNVIKVQPMWCVWATVLQIFNKLYGKKESIGVTAIILKQLSKCKEG